MTAAATHESWRAMKMEKAGEVADRVPSGPMPQELPMRESAPAVSNRPSDHVRAPSLNNNGPNQRSADVWAGAISRLQAQVTYNTASIEGHRRQFAELEDRVNRLHHEVGTIGASLDRIGNELRSRPVHSDHSRSDPGDLDILATQVTKLSHKVNEIDAFTMQMDLMKNRMRKLEDTALSKPPSHRPATSASHRDSSYYDAAPPPQQIPPQPAHLQHQHQSQHQNQHQHQPLPSMRTASTASLDPPRPPTFSSLPNSDSQNSHAYRLSSEPKPYPVEHPPPPSAQPPPGAFRPNEPLPPPGAIPGPPPISGWRPAEPYHPPHQTAAPPSERRSHGMDAEPPSSGWAAVNSNSAIKRPPEDRGSPYGSPMADGSKRPKLAPLMPSMPRSSYSDETYDRNYVPPGGSVPEDRSRAPSDADQPPSQAPQAPPAAGGSQHNYRFITSTAQNDTQEVWRGEGDRSLPSHPNAGSGRGGRGSRGGRRRGGGGGRGGRNSHDGHEHGTPEEWERPEWTGNQAPQNGFHHPAGPHSPSLSQRGGIMARQEGPPGAPIDRMSEYPSTPIHPSHPGADPYALDGAAGSSSAGKKTRTKPIRNAEGILIRKDGRPDMRSVSSANNLRKVHAKKESERAETTEGEEAAGEYERSVTPNSGAAVADGRQHPADNNEHASEKPDSRHSHHAPPGIPPDSQERHRDVLTEKPSNSLEASKGMREEDTEKKDTPVRAQPATNTDGRDSRTGREDEHRYGHETARRDAHRDVRNEHGSVEPPTAPAPPPSKADLHVIGEVIEVQGRDARIDKIAARTPVDEKVGATDSALVPPPAPPPPPAAVA